MTREQARLILGVEISASSDDIRSAHRRVMRSVHPDTNRTEEAERLARMANEAREILDPPALADDPEPPAHEPTEGEFEAARHHLATAADVIRTYLDTDPEERRLNTDLEEPGLEPPHVCGVVWDELIRRGVALGVGEAVCTMVCRTDFLQNGNNGGYWTYNGWSLRSVLDAPDPTEDEVFQSTRLSTICIAFGWVSLCVNVGQVLVGSSDATEDVLDGLLALQIILGAGAYRSRKLRFLRLAPNTIGRRLGELGRLVASIFCGVAVATGAAEVAIITILWILGAYALSGAFARARQRRAFTRARRWFEGANHPDLASGRARAQP